MLATGAADGLSCSSSGDALIVVPVFHSRHWTLFSWLRFSDGTYRLGREGCFPFSLFGNGEISYTRELKIQNTSFRLLTACLTGVFAG